MNAVILAVVTVAIVQIVAIGLIGVTEVTGTVTVASGAVAAETGIVKPNGAEVATGVSAEVARNGTKIGVASAAAPRTDHPGEADPGTGRGGGARIAAADAADPGTAKLSSRRNKTATAADPSATCTHLRPTLDSKEATGKTRRWRPLESSLQSEPSLRLLLLLLLNSFISYHYE